MLKRLAVLLVITVGLLDLFFALAVILPDVHHATVEGALTTPPHRIEGLLTTSNGIGTWAGGRMQPGPAKGPGVLVRYPDDDGTAFLRLVRVSEGRADYVVLDTQAGRHADLTIRWEAAGAGSHVTIEESLSIGPDAFDRWLIFVAGDEGHDGELAGLMARLSRAAATGGVSHR